MDDLKAIGRFQINDGHVKRYKNAFSLICLLRNLYIYTFGRYLSNKLSVGFLTLFKYLCRHSRVIVLLCLWPAGKGCKAVAEADNIYVLWMARKTRRLPCA